MSLNSKSIAIGIALLLAGLVAAYLLRAQAPAPALTSPEAPAGLVVPTPRLPIPAEEATLPSNKQPGLTRRVANPLELSHDLRAVYEQFKDSREANERHMAYRAWSACFPTFIAPQGQAVSIENLTQSFPKDDPRSAQRVEAYRNLQARCWKFSTLTRDETLNATRLQQEGSYLGTVLSPGEQAAKYLTEGNKAEAVRVAHAILASQDPYAIGSLREFINQIIVLLVDAQTLPNTERADLRSLAFTLAACQMGLECGSDSLSALQLCTSLGVCSGTVTERYLQALPSEADRTALKLETARVLREIQLGNFSALGL
jgi:hypothetical protein